MSGVVAQVNGNEEQRRTTEGLEGAQGGKRYPGDFQAEAEGE
jgi:hypothetical protein